MVRKSWVPSKRNEPNIGAGEIPGGMLLKLSGKTVADLKDDPEKLSESLKFDGDSMKELDQELVERFGFPFFIPLHPDKTFEEIEEYLLEVEPRLF
jgi:hypothetical protein